MMQSMIQRAVVIAALSFALPSPSPAVAAEDPFAQYVRATEPLAPEEQRKTFHLPPGFEIQLVAADPDVAKPMNLAFDARGRLWVTETRLYPTPAPNESAKKDAIKVLEDADGDGRAEKITTFADGLDIPIGILPLGDGSRVIAYDINNTCLYTDTDGDGKSDKREVLYSGWGYKDDTHGMSSNYRRGFDGWVYGTHGFNNTSAVKGGDGQVLHLKSGNTFRFRPDGSHIEAHTIGQVNPFGFCFDPLGNSYSSDSHSKPNYQLLRGGRYEAFDRDTNDGLGLAPAMMQHLHNSTAIAGIVFYAADQFPEEYRGDTFVGNVVTCRINRDKLTYAGSTPTAHEQPDFLTCDDPWFRPVNTVLGPDGALYVADFYNRIIAHYEIKLDHPGRDHQRGRIWRIVYTGDKPHAEPKRPRADWSKASADELVQDLAHANLTVRTIATDELADRIGKAAAGPVTRVMKAPESPAVQRAHGLWVLRRIGALPNEVLASAAKDAGRLLRVHAMRVLAEIPEWSSHHRELALAGLTDADALVQRCAADALGRHPSAEHVMPLIELRQAVPVADTHLLYTVRMALRDQLKSGEHFAALSQKKLEPAQALAVADVSLAIATKEAGAFLARHMEQLAGDARLAQFLRHAVALASPEDVDLLAEYVRGRSADDVDAQLEMFQSLLKGVVQAGGTPSETVRTWGADLSRRLLADAGEAAAWTGYPIDAGGARLTPSPWVIEVRASNDGDSASTFIGSLPRGEQLTGVLRSRPFSVPPKLSFYTAGHNGFPDKPDARKNTIRLRAAGTGEVLAEAVPPRHDVAHPVTWDLSPHAGEQGYLEVTDGATGTGYAWLAFGRLDPPVVPIPSAAPGDVERRQEFAATIARDLKLADLAPDLARLLANRSAGPAARAAAAGALTQVEPMEVTSAAGQIVQDPTEPMPLREAAADALGAVNDPTARTALFEAMRTVPGRLQTRLAQAMIGTPDGGAGLLAAVSEGKAPARLLQEPQIADRIVAANVPNAAATIKKLTRALPAVKQERQQLVDQRRDAFNAAKAAASVERGQAVFAKNCLVCHRVDSNGGLVGPQLDGVGHRGVERLVEDILDPSRNVDPAFRYSNVILKDTRLITGLEKRREGETIVFIDTTGKEQTVRAKDIKQRLESTLSVMPDNMGDMIPPEEFNDLLAYLLSNQAKTP